MPESAPESWSARRELAETAVFEASTHSSAPAVQLVSGARPSLADETVALLRTRLRALCWVMLIGCALFLVRTLVLRDAPLLSVRVTVLVVAAGMLVYLSRPHSHSLKRVRAVELIGLAALAAQSIALQVAGMIAGASAGGTERVLAPMFAAFTVWGIVVMAYGFFIPNTWKRATAIIVPAVLTPLATTLVLCRADPQVAALTDFNTVVTCTLTTCIAGLAAIYGTYTVAALRRESFAARRFGQYKLVRRLGGGGMGEVFLAEHALLKRPCAIKLIHPAHEADAVAVARFEREVHATANLSHWNTVDIFDYGRTRDGAFYYVMEYLPGFSLQEVVLRYGPIHPGRLVHLLRQTCQALAEAHAAGLVHRDIKPGNIFVAHRGGLYDVAKLLDFGLVAQFETLEARHASSTLDEPGYVSGTPLYMSPEQSRTDGVIDARSDIYSLGATAYFALTGAPPFTASERCDVLSAHRSAELVPPQQVDPTLPDDLCQTIARCLAKDPADRFADVCDLEQGLASCTCAVSWSATHAARWWTDHAEWTVPRRRGDGEASLELRQDDECPTLLVQ